MEELVTITIPEAPRAEDGTLRVRFEWDGRVIEALVAASEKAGSKLRIPARTKAEVAEVKAAEARPLPCYRKRQGRSATICVMSWTICVMS